MKIALIILIWILPAVSAAETGYGVKCPTRNYIRIYNPFDSFRAAWYFAPLFSSGRNL